MIQTQIDFADVTKMWPIHGDNAEILSICIEYRNGKPEDVINEDCQEAYDGFYNYLINSGKNPEDFIENEYLAEVSEEETTGDVAADEATEPNEEEEPESYEVDFEQIDDNEYRDLVIRHKFTQMELDEMHCELRRNINAHEETEKRQSEMASEYNAKKKELLNSIRELSKKIDVGTEEREARCVVKRDFEQGLILYFDPDTNELVEERPMTHDERQIDAFSNGYDPDAATQPDKAVEAEVIGLNDIVQ